MKRYRWVIDVCVWLFLTQALLAEGDPEGKRNLAESSDLPQGPGIAAEYPGDRKIAEDPHVVFADNFESKPYDEKWDSVRDSSKDVLSRVAPVPARDELGDRCLQVRADLRRNTGGGLTKWFEPVDPVFIRFYTCFAADSDYIHHFCTLRANRSLQGKDRWSGFGGAGIQPLGDERFSTALEPWGNWGRWDPPGRWNFYTYWHEMSASRDGKFWGNSFRPARQPEILRATWICAEFMLKHNTPGERDGEQAFWIDGKLMGHWKGINWRKTPQLRANAFTLESYVTDRWTKNPTNVVYFDNLVIADRYIGPSPTQGDARP
jgi:hypothetical protein